MVDPTAREAVRLAPPGEATTRLVEPEVTGAAGGRMSGSATLVDATVQVMRRLQHAGRLSQQSEPRVFGLIERFTTFVQRAYGVERLETGRRLSSLAALIAHEHDSTAAAAAAGVHR